MADISDDENSGVSQDRTGSESTGLVVIDPEDSFTDPGLEPHHPRATDEHPEAERRASRAVVGWFVLSALGALGAIVAYFAFPISGDNIDTVRPNNLFLGLGIGISMLALGIGAVHWARQLMADEEAIDERHPLRSDDETRESAVEILHQADQESGFGRRTLLRRSLIGAAVLAPLPGIVMLRDLAPRATEGSDPAELFRHTMWEKGTRLARDPDGTPIKASEVTIGSAFHVIPEGLDSTVDNWLSEKAKAVVLMVRLPEDELTEADDRKSWSYHGIVAYSKICTHVGCPVALVEQHTHHLLCPCHQSTFDVSDGAKVIFGPANRPLPQLPITVDSDGYLIAQSDFHEPIGPSFPERQL